MANHLIDLTGQRFGKLVVLERDTSKKAKPTFWICKCDCGNLCSISMNHLRSGQTESCGCLNQIDITCNRYGRWVVQERVKGRLWRCKCDCGTIKVLPQNTLIRGLSKSCGCYHRDEMIERQTTHGLSKTRIQRIYYDMLSRCNNKNDSRYYDYGGRGIYVCREWVDGGLKVFADWSFSSGYDESKTIDRIDNDGPYSPENCRWATREQQTNNKRNTIYFEFGGEKKSLNQWVKFMGWNYDKYYGRYHRGYETFREDDVAQIIEKLKRSD